MTNVREYAYQPRWALLVFVALFFAVCAAVLGSVAARNERPGCAVVTR
jgi:hypothetical protein